jgi:hypothetical protein
MDVEIVDRGAEGQQPLLRRGVGRGRQKGDIQRVTCRIELRGGEGLVFRNIR